MNKRFVEILSESYEVKIYVENDLLWFAHSQGSGTALTLKTYDRIGYFTDKSGDHGFDPVIVNEFKKFAAKNKPLKTKGDSKLYNLDFYNTTKWRTMSGVSQPKFDVWGGDTKPTKKWAFIINQNDHITVVNIFKSKKEAQSWIKHTV